MCGRRVQAVVAAVNILSKNVRVVMSEALLGMLFICLIFVLSLIPMFSAKYFSVCLSSFIVLIHSFCSVFLLLLLLLTNFLYNICLDKYYFPIAFKHAQITTLHNKGDLNFVIFVI